MNEIKVVEKPFIYLACPYSHENKEVSLARFRAVSKVAGQLIQAGNILYSPISHTHPIAIEASMRTGYAAWEEVDKFYLERCDMLIVLMLHGWQFSGGVAKEIEFVNDLGKPVLYLPEINATIRREGDNVSSSTK